MEATGAGATADPIGEVTGVHITDTAGLMLTLRTPDAGGTAGAGYALPEEQSFTDALCQVVEKSPSSPVRPLPRKRIYRPSMYWLDEGSWRVFYANRHSRPIVKTSLHSL